MEDEPLVSMDMESTLTTCGCKVVGTAGTLEKAKAPVERVTCDFAPLDVNVAGQSVDEIAAKLTQTNTPFAFVSGYGRADFRKVFRTRS